MLLSVLGVTVGIALFIMAQAVSQGFKNFYVQSTVGTRGSIVIGDRFQSRYSMLMGDSLENKMIAIENQKPRKFYPGIPDAYRVIRVLKTYPQVVACSPIVEDRAFIRSGLLSEVTNVQGIDLELHLDTTDLSKQVIKGSLEEFRNDGSSILIGSLLADKMQIDPGENVYIKSDEGDSRRFKVAGVFQSGINAIDEKTVYLHRKAAQSVLRKPYYTSSILVRVQNPEEAPALAAAFEDHLSHRSRPWQDREKAMLATFQAISIFATISVAAIILMAGFAIFFILNMSVLNKTKEISILRSMGYFRSDISAIFLWQGALLSLLGIFTGSLLGALLTGTVSTIPIKIRGIFQADHFIVTWAWEHYLTAAILSMITCFLSAYYPARRAARLQPVDVLRGTSQ
jgi:lipoprotein-releasing system permease protein